MNLGALIHPFARLRRLPFIGALLLALALGYGGLYGLRFGGELGFAGLALIVLALWMFLSIMCNRTRDADASPGWTLFPVFITALSIFAVWKIGYFDFSDFILGPATTRVDKIATAPFRPLTMFASIFIPAAIGALLSGIAWLIGFIGLAVLPSRNIAR